MPIQSMDYNSLNSDILKINPKVRYAGIYQTGNVQMWEKCESCQRADMTLEQVTKDPDSDEEGY